MAAVASLRAPPRLLKPVREVADSMTVVVVLSSMMEKAAFASEVRCEMEAVMKARRVQLYFPIEFRKLKMKFKKPKYCPPLSPTLMTNQNFNRRVVTMMIMIELSSSQDLWRSDSSPLWSRDRTRTCKPYLLPLINIKNGSYFVTLAMAGLSPVRFRER